MHKRSQVMSYDRPREHVYGHSMDIEEDSMQGTLLFSPNSGGVDGIPFVSFKLSRVEVCYGVPEGRQPSTQFT